MTPTMPMRSLLAISGNYPLGTGPFGGAPKDKEHAQNLLSFRLGAAEALDRPPPHRATGFDDAKD